MRAQYEEKTFESYFNAELSRRGIFYFPPGQVQEGSMGADAIVMSTSRWLWWKLGYSYLFSTPFAGSRYREMAEEMEMHLGREITDVPEIHGNIFFQYKRSEHMVLKSAEEWTHWGTPYYRYEIYPEQHSLLEHLHQKFGSQVLILYAAPAVEDVNQLVDQHIAHNVIANTNFRPADELTGHKRNTFVAPGGHSWACSEPSRLEPFNLEYALVDFKLSDSTRQAGIASIGKGVEEVLLASRYAQPYRALLTRYGGEEPLLESAPLLNGLITMAILRELTGIQWVVVRSAK